MTAGNTLAGIAETQIGTRGDLESGKAALYGYLLATDTKLGAFQPEWARQGFGTAFHYRLLNPGASDPQDSSGFRLRDAEPAAPEFLLRIHSWCAAFVDWCILRLLLTSPYTTSLTLAHRPKTASAFGLLQWGKTNDCAVFEGSHHAPERGDIAVFTFSHTGIVTQPGNGQFLSVEGNTTPGTGGNQGYLVEQRWRATTLLKGLIRLPPKSPLGDYNVSSRVSQTA